MLLPDLEYDPPPPPPVGVRAVPDTTPPAIVLQGQAEDSVRVFEAYIDAGAFASDDRDASVLLTVGGLPVDTGSVTQPGAPRQVTYSARDSAGNAATVVRSVSVYDDCVPQGEVRCKETKQCSLFGSCNPLAASLSALAISTSSTGASSSGGAAVQPEQQQPVARGPAPDRSAPTIAVLGDGVLFRSADGSEGMLTTVTVGSAYSDAGAAVTDTVDDWPPNPPSTSDITSKLVVSGADDVDTSRPTPPGKPWVVTYDASDAAGNRAPTKRRRVLVVCGGGEKPCEDVDNPGTFFCSTGGGVCGTASLAAASAASSSAAGGTGAADSAVNGASSSTSSSTATSPQATQQASTSSTAAAAAAGTEQQQQAAEPTLSLLGPSAMTVSQGARFARCVGSVTTACDPGVSASLASMGDLDGRVRACPEKANVAVSAQAGHVQGRAGRVQGRAGRAPRRRCIRCKPLRFHGQPLRVSQLSLNSACSM